jgi:hypothetical protein
VLRRRQKRRLRRVGIGEAGIRCFARAAAAAEAGHRLHELRGRVVGAAHGRARRSRRVGGEAAGHAELPVEADRAKARRSGELIVGDVVHLECAGVDVAQHQGGGAGGADGSDARKLPIQAHQAEGDGASEPVVVDVVDLQCTRVEKNGPRTQRYLVRRTRR